MILMIHECECWLRFRLFFDLHARLPVSTSMCIISPLTLSNLFLGHCRKHLNDNCKLELHLLPNTTIIITTIKHKIIKHKAVGLGMGKEKTANETTQKYTKMTQRPRTALIQISPG